jgi:hypothetical protein
MSEVSSVELFGGAMADVPLWSNAEGCRNWAAIIKPDPDKPGGCDREFLRYARGDWFYVLKDMRVKKGTIIEFASDFPERPRRVYCLVTRITKKQLDFQSYWDARDAFKAAREM